MMLSTGIVRASLAAMACAALSLACLTPVRVSTELEAGTDFAAYRTFVVAPVILREGELERNAEFERELRDRATSAIAERGYVGDVEGAALLVQVMAGWERVPRRSVSSDPDANATVIRDVPEAVVIVTLLDRAERRLLWRGEGRSRIPNVSPPGADGRNGIWFNALAEVVARVPGT